MNRRGSPLFGCAILLGDIGACSSLFGVFRMVETGVLNFPALPVWAPCALGAYLTLYFLCQKPRSQRTLVLVCAGWFLLQAVAAFWLCGIFAGRYGLFAALVMWSVSYCRGYHLARQIPAAEKLVTGFELSVLVLVFSLFYCSVRQISCLGALPAAASALLTLGALVARRTAGGRNSGDGRGAGLLIGLLGLFGAIALVLTGAAAGGIRAGALWLWRVLMSAVRALGRAIGALVQFLASLFPDTEVETVLPEAPEALPPMEETGELYLISGDWFMTALLILLAVGLAAAVIWLVIRGGARLLPGHSGSSVGIHRRRLGLWALLRRWGRRLSRRIRFGLNTVLRRSTAPGLFLWLERRCRPNRRRRKGETCREFLLRIAPDYPGGETALETLAQDMDRLYFGGGSRLSRSEIRQLRRLLRRCRRETPAERKPA